MSTEKLMFQYFCRFVMVMFMNDTIVQPKESQWFGFYSPGQDTIIRPLNESPVYEDVSLKDCLFVNFFLLFTLTFSAWAQSVGQRW